jgi:hypothetical protein
MFLYYYVTETFLMSTVRHVILATIFGLYFFELSGRHLVKQQSALGWTVGIQLAFSDLTAGHCPVY